MFEHDYNRYPELTNTQLQVMGLTSPHHQYTTDFSAVVVKVHDGDTITLRSDLRDFDFPLRLLDINAPELNESGGDVSRDWLKAQIEGEEVQILIDPNQRVGKYGRLLGYVISKGMNMNEILIMRGYATPFDNRREGQIPTLEKTFSGAIA